MVSNIEESLEGKILAGCVIGTRVLNDYNKIALVGINNNLSIATISSIESAYISVTGGECRCFCIEDIPTTVEELQEYKPSMIVIAINGIDIETLKDTVYSLFLRLEEIDIDADFMINVDEYSQNIFDVLRSDEIIRTYLADKRLITPTIDIERGIMEIKEVYLLKDRIYLETVEEYPVFFKLVKIMEKFEKEGS